MFYTLQYALLFINHFHNNILRLFQEQILGMFRVDHYQEPTGSPGSRDFPAGTFKMAGNFGRDFYKIVLDFDF